MSDSIFDDMSIDELDELKELDSLEEEILEHYGTPRHSGRSLGFGPRPISEFDVVYFVHRRS